jgi:hypothetical protein
VREKLKGIAITWVVGLGLVSMCLLGANEMLMRSDRAACHRVPQAEFIQTNRGLWQCRLQLHDGTYVQVENPRTAK